MDLRIGGLGEATEIGSGSTSVVYRAQRLSDGQDVAVKVLNVADPAFVARFEREAAMLTSLSRSPRIVTVHEVGTTERGRPYLVLDLCRSTLLERIERDGLIEPAEACAILAEITEAVADAHQIDIVHRDLKPGNVLVSDAGDHLVADFGIGTFMGATTTGGSGIGFTAGYVAPETLTGDPPGPPADVYALGATLFHMLSGRAPFVDPSGESNLFALANRIANDPVADLRPDGVSDEVCRLMEAAMAKDPDARPPVFELHRRLLALGVADRAEPTPALPAEPSSPLLAPASVPSPPAVPGYRNVTFLERERELSVFLAQPESGPIEGSAVVAVRVADRRQSDLGRRRRLRTRWNALAVAATHPRLAPIDGHGFTADGRAFIALVHHEGERVADRAAAVPLSWTEVTEIGVRVAAGLEVLSRHGLVHGNVRPTAVLVDVDKGPVLGDYAIAGPDLGPDPEPGSGPGPGHEMGAAGPEVWTAPELTAGGRATVASDLFGLGATLARLAGATLVDDPALLARTLDADKALVTAPDRLRRVLLAMVDPDPLGRPSTALEVIEELRSLQLDHGLAVTPSLLEPPPPMPPPERAAPVEPSALVDGAGPHSAAVRPAETVLGDDLLRQLGFDAAVGPAPAGSDDLAAEAARTADLTEIMAAHRAGRQEEGIPPAPGAEPAAPRHDHLSPADRWSTAGHHRELPVDALRRFVAGIVVAAVGLGVGVYVWQQRDVPGDTTVADSTISPATPVAVVPIVADVDERNAVARVHNAGFTAVITHRFEPEAPRGTILSATPPPGSTAEIGSPVELVVSLGREPSCAGTSREAVRRELDLRGVAVTVVTEVFSDSVEAGTVMRCEFDTEAPSAVVYVSKGPES